MIGESATVGTAEPLTMFDMEMSVSVACPAAARLRRMISTVATLTMMMATTTPPAISGIGICEAAGSLMATTSPILSRESVIS